MVTHLKLQKHKGIVEVTLENLGRVNVLCGKNNSGKTSILEAIRDGAGIGKPVVDVEWFASLFEPIYRGYSSPSPDVSRDWVERCLTSLKDSGTILYHNEVKQIAEQLDADRRQDSVLGRYGSLFKYDTPLSGFFQKTVASFKPVLIPPKRTLECTVSINLNQALNANGEGVTNRLFLMKNQDLESDEYKTYEGIYSAFKNISGCSFNIFPDASNNLTVYFRRGDKEWIQADSCGQGLSDLLVIVFFMLEPDSTFVMIEEPENHMHPDMQRRLLQCLREVKSKQFLLSTHSNVFLDPHVVDKVYYAEMADTVSVTDQTSRSKILSELGYSIVEHVAADALVLVEGPKDATVLRKVCDWLWLTKDYDIKFWPLGGDIMEYHDLSVFGHMTNVLAMVDSDPGSAPIRTRFKRHCDDAGIPCKVLSRYAVENYLSAAAIKQVYPEVTLDAIQPDAKVDKQLGFSQNKSVKSKLVEILENMTLSDIEGTDLLDVCNEIGSICRARSVGVLAK